MCETTALWTVLTSVGDQYSDSFKRELHPLVGKKRMMAVSCCAFVWAKRFKTNSVGFLSFSCIS